MVGIVHKAVKSTMEKGYASEWNDDHEVTGNIPFNQFQGVEFVVENGTGFPAGPVEGQLFYRSDQHTFYHWNGTIWVAVQGPATVVVAADGSGQTTDIQDGIDMLPITGGVVYVKEGPYVITASIRRDIENVSLKGAGHSTTISTIMNAPLIHWVSDHFTIDGFNLEGNNAGAGQNGIYLNGVDNSSVLNCWIKDMGSVGIYLDGSCGSCWFMGSWIEGTEDSSIYIESAIDCIFSNNFCDRSGGDGVEVGTSCQRCKFTNNNIKGMDFDGFFMSGNQNNISDNTVSACADTGIEIFGSPSNIINNNVVTNSTNDGILITGASSDYNIIMGNRCCDNGGWEINVAQAGCQKNIVVGNQLLVCTGAHGGALQDLGTNTEKGHNVVA